MRLSIHVPVVPPLIPEHDADQELGERMRLLRKPLERFFARKASDPSEVDDLVQEVFLRIVRRGPMDTFEHFTGYAFQTADSVWKDRGRRRIVRQVDRHVVFDADTHGASQPAPEGAMIAQQELRRTSVALALLPERTRAVFLMRRLDRLPFAEIAVRLGISVSAAEKHMQRATQHLLASSREGL